jgi:hypothetical protein
VDHEWVRTTFSSNVNLNGDSFEDAGWYCENCKFAVLFPSLAGVDGRTFSGADYVVASPNDGVGLERVEALARSCGAPDCDSQLVRYVMMS